jgi:hypothetical protein
MRDGATRKRRSGRPRFPRPIGHAVAFGLVLGLLGGVTVAAQESGPLHVTKPDRIWIRGQIQGAIARLERVIVMLTGPTGSEELKRADQMTVSTYTLCNHVALGLQHLSNAQRYDPLLPMALDQINRVRDITRTAHSRIQRAAAYEQGRQEQVAAAITQLQQAIAQAEAARDLL